MDYDDGCAGMIQELKPYSSYKDSGVEWLGDVPEHWVVVSLRYLVVIRSGEAPPADKDVIGHYPVFGANGIIGRCSRFNSKEQHVVVGRVGTAGAVNVTPREAWITDNVLIIDPLSKSILPAFLPLLLNVVDLASLTNQNAQPLITGGNIKSRKAIVPPLPEQTAIVRFLDYADNRIRRSIHAKQKLIKLLEEEKQAVIHQAVTRGLDPDVRLKPSGVEWLGDVPEHWDVVTLRRVISRAVDGPHHSPNYLDKGIPFLSARNIRVDHWKLDDAKFISEQDYADFSKRVVPEIGDVLYTKGGTTGVARVVDLEFRFQVWVHVAVLKIIQSKIIPEFLATVLNSPLCYEQAQLFTRGATNQDLGLNRMKNIVFTLPPLTEQQTIMTHINKMMHSILSEIERAYREIALLREYRTRLIADVVTGKLDVREAAANLPDEDDGLGQIDACEALDKGDDGYDDKGSGSGEEYGDEQGEVREV
ncbi:restriction endonuclease subunit S [Methanogenium cariaci]